MLAIMGLVLTGFGTILAIVHPTIGAEWAGDDTLKREYWLQLRYYAGISLIVIGTLLQIIAGWTAR